MKKAFSKMWKASKQPRKQRKYRRNAPLHIKSKFMNSTLSKELRKKHGKRSMRLRKEDKVKVMRGQYKGKIGSVISVDLKNQRAVVENIEMIKKDGSKVPYPLHPSALMITELKTGDKKRMKKLEAKK